LLILAEIAPRGPPRVGRCRRGRGETRQWLVGSPEFRNTYTMHLGRSCFVILNKHMRAADILLLIAADRKKFRNHMIEHMAFRTHMGTHDICAQRCPPFQRFALALARSQGRPTRLLARHSARIDGGDHSPHHPDATTHDRHHWQQKRCARASRMTKLLNRSPRIASGGGIPRTRASQHHPPLTVCAWGAWIVDAGRPGPLILGTAPHAARVPPAL
jgi:hypothetical protein